LQKKNEVIYVLVPHKLR